MDSEKLNFIIRVEAFRESEGFQLYRRIRKSRLILYTLRYNFITLKRSFDNFHLRESHPAFWNNVTPYLRWNTQKRITADILNYLSSAGSIIGISRSFPEVELNPEALENYKRLINDTFVENIEFTIIKKLRNYILHYSLLEVGVSSRWHLKIGRTKNTFLFTDKLLEWDRWNIKERRFIESRGKHFDIEPVVYRYHAKFSETQDFLFLEVIKNYQVELNNVLTIMNEMIQKGIDLGIENSLPFRKSTYRYLRCLLNKVNCVSL